MDGKTDDSALEALTKENEALKTKSTALSSDLAARDAKIADLESQMVSIKQDAEKEVSTLKSTIEKYTADMPTVIKSALEAHDAANSEKLAYAASVTELKSVMKDEPAAEFLKTEPNTAQIMSMVKALKSANTGEVGIGAGADLLSTDKDMEKQLTSMGYSSIEFKEGN